MATLSEILSDPKALEAIFRGLIGAGTAAAGISQATTPQTTTTVRGAPPAPSDIENRLLQFAFGNLTSQLPGQGITPTARGLSFRPTGDEQQSALGLRRAIAALQSRVGGGPLSQQGPADAMSNAALTRKPAFDRSRLISAIQGKLGGPISGIPGQGGQISGTSGQGGVLNLERGNDGVFALPGANGGDSTVDFPSVNVDFPSSAVGSSPGIRASQGSSGGFGSVLGIGTGILGAGAGALQIAKALGLIGGRTGGTGDATLEAIKAGGPAAIRAIQALAGGGSVFQPIITELINSGNIPAALELVQRLTLGTPGMTAVGEGAGIQGPFFEPGMFGPSTITEETLGSGFGELAFNAPQISGSVLGLGGGSGAPFESAFSGLDFAGPGASSAALEGGGGLIGMGGLSGALIAAGIPLSIVLGMLPFLGQRAQKEKAKEKGFAANIARDVSNPAAWRAQILSEHPQLQPFVDAALAGGINSIDDALRIFQQVAGQPLPKEDVGGVFSGWANRFIGQPGEQLWGPSLIESNKASIAELLGDPTKSERERESTQLETLREQNSAVGVFERNFMERNDRMPTLEEVLSWLDNRERE